MYDAFCDLMTAALNFADDHPDFSMWLVLNIVFIGAVIAEHIIY